MNREEMHNLMIVLGLADYEWLKKTAHARHISQRALIRDVVRGARESDRHKMGLDPLEEQVRKHVVDMLEEQVMRERFKRLIVDVSADRTIPPAALPDPDSQAPATVDGE